VFLYLIGGEAGEEAAAATKSSALRSRNNTHIKQDYSNSLRKTQKDDSTTVFFLL
jgi:hypothetical protein